MKNKIIITLLVLLLLVPTIALASKDEYLTLISNTPSCLNDCRTDYQITNANWLTSMTKNDIVVDYKNKYNKIAKPNTEVLEQFTNSYQEPIYETVCTKEQVTLKPNKTIEKETTIDVEKCNQVEKDSKTIYFQDWRPLQTTELKPGQSLNISIRGSIGVGEKVDNIITLNNAGFLGSYTYPEYAWWDGTFTKCQNINVTGGISALTNYTFYQNVTYNANMRADMGDIRFVNSTCNNGGILMDSEPDYIINSNSGGFHVKATYMATGINQWSYYYDNPSATMYRSINTFDTENATGIGGNILHLSENTGTITEDSKHLSNATLTGNNKWTVGVFGSALRSYDKNSKLVVNLSANNERFRADEKNGETIQFWYKNNTVIDGAASDNLWGFVDNSDGTKQQRLFISTEDLLKMDNNAEETKTAGATLNSLGVRDGNFHLITIKYNLTGMYMYIDGIKTIYSGAATASSSVSTLDMTYFYAPAKANAGTNCTLDELRFYRKGLTENQIARDYQNANMSSAIISGGEVSSATEIMTATSLTPADNFITKNSNVAFSCNSTLTTGDYISSVNLTIRNSTGWIGELLNTTIATNSSIWNTSFTFTYDGNYTWNCLAQSSHSINATSATRQLAIDTIAPYITIVYPTNTTYNSNVSKLNYTINHAGLGLSSCWYSPDLGVTNITLTNCGTNGITITTTEGTNRFDLWANDTLNNVNTTSVTFFKDTINPLISIVYPLNNSNFTTTIVQINYSVSDAYLQSCWWSFNTGSTNTTITCGVNITNTWLDGNHKVMVWANDSLNNVNNSIVNFITDTVAPTIDIVYPLNTTYNSNVSELNYSVSDSHIAYCWYSTNLGATNTSVTCGNNITGLISNEGSNTWYLWVNDTFGHNNYTSITFFKDNVVPSVNIAYPENKTYSSMLYEMDYNISDLHLNACWFSNNSGVTNITFTCNTYPNNLILGMNYTQGTNTLNLWANDTFANVNNSVKVFFIDSITPVIYFENETDVNGSYVNRPWLVANVTAIDTNLKNITLVSAQGFNTSNISANYKLILNFSSDGLYTLNAYALDLMSHIAYAEVVARRITIDTIKPVPSFVNPTTSTNITVNHIEVNVSTTDTNYANVTVNFYNSTGLIDSTNSNSNPYYIEYSSLIDDTYYFNATAYDLASNKNYTNTQQIIIDTKSPLVNIIKPVNNNIFLWNTNINLNFSAYDTGVGVQSCWYSLDSGANIAIPNCNNVTLNVTNTNHILNLFVNDTVNNINTTQVNFTNVNTTITNVYSTPVLELSAYPFAITIQKNESVSVIPSFYYNYTAYSGSYITNTNSSPYETYTINALAPGVATNNFNISFRWMFNFSWNTNSILTNNSLFNQTVKIINVVVNESCSDTIIKCFNYMDEQNLTALQVDDVAYNVRYGTSLYPDKKVIYGNLSYSNNTCLCFSENTTIGYGEIQYARSGYAERRNYLFSNLSFYNSTNTTIYSLTNSKATSFLFEFKDTSINPYVGYYTELLRWYPELNLYNIVEMAKTDNKGQTIMRVQTEDVDYRVGLFSQTGALVKLLDPVRFACLVSPCTYSSLIPTTVTDYSAPAKIYTTFSFNKTTNIWTFIYSDPTATTNNMTLLVVKETGLDNIVICNTTTSGFIGVMYCNSTGYTGTLRGIVFRTASPLVALWDKTVDVGSYVFKSGIGLFITFIFIALLGLIGLVSPEIAIILSIVGALPAIFLGAISWTIGLSWIAIGIIIIYVKNKVRT